MKNTEADLDPQMVRHDFARGEKGGIPGNKTVLGTKTVSYLLS